MSESFYGVIERVDLSDGKLGIRCVRNFFHGDGLMADDVWVWDIEGAEKQSVEDLNSLIGHTVCFDLKETKEGLPVLTVLDDDGVKSVSVAAKSIRKTTSARDQRDLVAVVEDLSRQFRQAESLHLSLGIKISAVVGFVEEKIERAKRRVEFEVQRGSNKPDGLIREIEDLQTILKKLKESDSGS